MTRHRHVGTFTRCAAVIGLAMLAAVPATPQTYDANCNKRDYSADELLQHEICSSHGGCRLVMLAQKACKAKDFLANLRDRLTGRSQPDNWDVMEALNQQEVPQTPGVRETNARAISKPYYAGGKQLAGYDRSNAAQVQWNWTLDHAGSGAMRRSRDGVSYWFEGSGSVNDGKPVGAGSGSLIKGNGEVEAGSFQGGQLAGDGVRRDGNGGWQAGTFSAGQLNGRGYTGGAGADGRVMEGTFLGGKPDGMMLVTWPDGSARKEFWKDGQMVSAGARVAKGQIPPPAKTPEQLVAEQKVAEEVAAAAREKQFAAELEAAPNAGALYAIGDEWAEKGDMTKARAAWRALVRRYSGSPLALRAADRLAGGGGAGDAAGGASGASPEAPLPAYKCTAGPDAAFRDYDAELGRWNAENPVNRSWGMRDTYQFAYFAGTQSLRILARYKGCMSDVDYKANLTPLENLRDSGLAGCRQTSNDGGRNCVARYPGR